MLRRIAHELRHHVPFTLGGTLVGVAIMLVMYSARVPQRVSHLLFSAAHPTHVFLSAMVTAGMYRLHGRGRWWAAILIGYVGAIGIATLSDSLIPFAGEAMLGLPAHVHAGFIEEWYIVNPVCLAGIAVAYFWPRTRFPHAGHVLLSTWASLFHMTMHLPADLPGWKLGVLPVFLFLAVWVPCCTSDIVFPLLFVKPGDRGSCRHCEAAGRTAPAVAPASRGEAKP